MVILRATLLLVFLTTNICAEEKDTPSETRLKAAYLYQFCNYIQWPAESFSTHAAPLVISIAGDEGLAAELAKSVVGRRINNRSIDVRHVPAGVKPIGSHVLYIAHAQMDEHNEQLLNAEHHPVVTVTETTAYSARGIINFVVVNNRLRFDISQQQAQRLGLKLSSQLLAVARHVEKG